MSYKYKIIKLELSAIYVVSALLVLSLLGLGTRVAYANSITRVESMYPNLYCNVQTNALFHEEKTAYFTFDDGPSHNTEKILDILREQDAKATFFVCAQESDDADSPALLRRILDEGHEIGLHSYTHDYKKIYSSLDRYLEDLSAINDYVIEATGYRASIVRFPGGSGTMNASRSLIKKISGEIERRGYVYYDWDIDSGDALSKSSPETLAEKVANKTNNRDRVIILMHDTPAQKTTPDAVRLAIPELRKQGYTFDKLN